MTWPCKNNAFWSGWMSSFYDLCCSDWNVKSCWEPWLIFCDLASSVLGLLFFSLVHAMLAVAKVLTGAIVGQPRHFAPILLVVQCHVNTLFSFSSSVEPEPWEAKRLAHNHEAWSQSEILCRFFYWRISRPLSFAFSRNTAADPETFLFFFFVTQFFLIFVCTFGYLDGDRSNTSHLRPPRKCLFFLYELLLAQKSFAVRAVEFFSMKTFERIYVSSDEKAPISWFSLSLKYWYNHPSGLNEGFTATTPPQTTDTNVCQRKVRVGTGHYFIWIDGFNM
jgi:hypothetical protein